MDPRQADTAAACLKAAEANAMTFPEIVGALMAVGFEGYEVDLRQARATYFLPSGEALALGCHESPVPVAPAFDAAAIQAAIREAQTLSPGYTYLGFCDKAKAAGCAGYMVSFTGRRALYFGRTAQTHVELFPGTA
ncbi:DUF1398 family protein [Xanthobacter pseudotagetidis]|uniref:DUF1398 family protein n=1 Tax=Xanthobacter pseudotagetidis TaxID=3119911 RepID=UPI003726F4F0